MNARMSWPSLQGIAMLALGLAPPGAGRAEPLEADSAVDVELSPQPVAAGDELEVWVEAARPARSAEVDCPMLGWQSVALEADAEGFIGWLLVPDDAEPGRHEVRVAVVDRLGQRLEQSVTLFVRPAPEARAAH